ncbi:MAG: hypothetical protein JSV61_02240 [Anaerolineales bacterium]|nr:MAG: hypothetical protein JSV61_02240 [Anaerolineales bacterium]
MNALRRTLGVLVMVAGILGLVLSLAGLISVWVARPTVAGYVETTIQTLDASLRTSQKAMEVTGQALGATVDSVDALSTMLSTTAASVEDTKPILEQINLMMGETMPATLDSASDSLKTAQQAAVVLESAIKSLENFRTVLSATPFLSSLVEQPEQTYDPQVPLADSLGELATTLEDLPATFTEMSVNLGKADNNLVTIQGNLTTMSESVSLISVSLSEYQSMISQSQSSMDNLMGMLTNIQDNLARILDGVAMVFSLFFLWLLAAQVVILSQGLELYRGIAGGLESGEG